MHRSGHLVLNRVLELRTDSEVSGILGVRCGEAMMSSAVWFHLTGFR